MTTVQYLLGIDGGGTRCRARLRATDGTLLGQGEGGPANIRLGLDTAWANMAEAIDAAFARAGLSREHWGATAIGLGLAGIVTDADGERTIAAGPDFARARAGSDGLAACLGAFGGRDGAILITGTGSAANAWVDGQEHAIGGYGFEVSDRGSAAELGRRAIARALDGHDGIRSHGPCTRALMEALGGSGATVVAWVNRATPAAYGSWAPLVLGHAGAGDPTAIALVRQTADDVEAQLRRLHALGAPAISLVGGMAEPITPWLSPWARGVIRPPEHDAMEGAVLLARRAVDIPESKETRP